MKTNAKLLIIYKKLFRNEILEELILDYIKFMDNYDKLLYNKYKIQIQKSQIKLWWLIVFNI